ncbi:MAG TPA: putative Fe-S cluster assembly protein SufT [Candidatus Binatia bacterium]|jgi:probable FeS assembly SUF system protein SufT
MKSEKPIALTRDCTAVLIPSGETIVLPAGSSIWLRQSLGGSYTVMTDHGHMARIDARDGDVLGLPQAEPKTEHRGGAETAEAAERLVWEQLRNCYDPEIPVNIVDLGLIYECTVRPAGAGGYKASVRFTLTAPGCGMGQFLAQDIRSKLLAVPAISEADVELVWDPPWNQSRISGAAKQQLGIE